LKPIGVWKKDEYAHYLMCLGLTELYLLQKIREKTSQGFFLAVIDEIITGSLSNKKVVSYMQIFGTCFLFVIFCLIHIHTAESKVSSLYILINKYVTTHQSYISQVWHFFMRWQMHHIF
jgi:hypothetical protein